MIDIVKQKMFNVILINCDFFKELFDEIKNKYFDYIISIYVIYYLIDKEKIKFIELFFLLLNVKGKILIGDVFFEIRNKLEKSKEKYSDFWDNDEVYFVLEEIEESFNGKYDCRYIKILYCVGVLVVIERIL